MTQRLVKTPKLYFLDTGLAAYLTAWASPETLEAGAMSGPLLETWIVAELFKSYWHAGRQPPFTYYRDKDQHEIDLLLVQDGIIYPLEIKKTAARRRLFTETQPVDPTVSSVQEDNHDAEVRIQAVVAMAGLGAATSFGQRAAGLHERGLYRWSRNPQLLGGFLAVIGVVLLWPSPYAVGWAAMYGIMGHWMVLAEEEHLRKQDAGYERYCRRVPRYFGFPRRER